MNLRLCPALMLALLVGPGMLIAQPAKKKTSKPAVVTKPALKYKVCVLPEFYNYLPIKAGDTTFSFESYDRNDNKINIDYLPNIDNAEEVFVIKSYFQYPYKPGAVISPPYLSAKIYVFERTSAHTWIGKDIATKKKTAFREDVTKITRRDTMEVMNKDKGVKEIIIHKYYKTNIVDEASVPPGTHVH